jgi:hypothetical protein
MIPGSNILNMALRVIAPQSLQYYAYKSRSENDIGYLQTTYEEPVTVLGSFQAVPRSVYSFMGLDFSKQYFMFYASENIQTLNRGRSGDKLTFNGQTFEVMSDTSWHSIDGWNGIMCVLIDNETIPPVEEPAP